MKDGLLALPTHTWSYINKENPLFSVNESSTCIGILTELFRQRENVVRFHIRHILSRRKEMMLFPLRVENNIKKRHAQEIQLTADSLIEMHELC